MGEFIGKHFVAAYQQAGDFKVVNVGGRIQRNGGNVASYFCSADARVSHAVGKNVSADRLLRAAQWAVETFQRVGESAPTNLDQRAQLFERAHLAELKVDRSAFHEKVKLLFPEVQRIYLEKQKTPPGRTARYRSSYDQIDPPVVEARLRAARQYPGDRAHQILAAQPWPVFSWVAKRLFEDLSGERFTSNRARIYLAAEGLQRARDRNRPVLLVLYRGSGADREQFDDATRRLFTEVLSQPAAADLLRSFVVVAVPLRQFSALTSLADLPTYETPRDASPLVIVTGSDGEQVAALTGVPQPDELSGPLWQAWTANRLSRAEAQVEAGEFSAALRLLRQALTRTTPLVRRQEVLRRIDQVNLKLSDQWASQGKTRLALRLLTRVESQTKDDQLRDRASRRVTELRSTL